MEYIKNRLSERWTWVAIFGVVATFTGFNLTDAQEYSIAFLGMVLAGSPDEALNSIFKKGKL